MRTGLRGVREVLFSMVYILSQALETMFPIFNQGHRVVNQHPGASSQSTQPQETAPFVLHTMALCVCARACVLVRMCIRVWFAAIATAMPHAC